MTFTKLAFIKTLSLKYLSDNDLFVWTSVSFHSAEMSPHVWLLGMYTALVLMTGFNLGISAGVKMASTVQNHTDDYLDYLLDHNAAGASDFRI